MVAAADSPGGGEDGKEFGVELAETFHVAFKVNHMIYNATHALSRFETLWIIRHTREMTPAPGGH